MTFSPISIRLKTTPFLTMSRTLFPLKFLLSKSFSDFPNSKPNFSFIRPVVASSSSSSVSSPYKLRRRNNLSSSPYLYKQSFGFGRYAYDEYDSERDSDRETQSSQQLGASTLDNIEEWKWKLSTLIRNKNEQEVVSRERKDRRDYQQIAALAARMGLCSQQYSKVVVISKVPLPNYRSDLDDKRPQREVVLPYGLQEQLVTHLKKYLVKKSTDKDLVLNNPDSRLQSEGNLATNKGIYEQEEQVRRTSPAAERILQRRSLEILNKQQSWQVDLNHSYA